MAIVTGGGRGIGRAVALKLGRLGAKVVVNYRASADAAGEVAAAIEAEGGSALAVAADVGRAPEAARLVETAVATFGRVDILVNNAGITRDALLVRMSEEDWEEVMAVDLKGAFLCARAALKPMLRQRWGRIINVASVVGEVGNPGQANYVAAKAGLLGLTKAAAREVASRGITVNAVAPGFIDTDMTRPLGPPRREDILKQIPLGRFGTPHEVAEAVAFLASEEAAYITGQVLNVDGGLVMA